MLRGRSHLALWLCLLGGWFLGWQGERLVAPPVDVNSTLPARPASTLLLESTGWLERGPSFPKQVEDAAARAGLDPALVVAVIEAESGHDPHAVSARGAIGLMQVLPETGASLGFEQVADPAVNLEAGCRYLAMLLERFGGDVELALAAYNAGPGAVRRWGTIPPYRETRDFIARVAAAYRSATGVELDAAARFSAELSGVL